MSKKEQPRKSTRPKKQEISYKKMVKRSYNKVDVTKKSHQKLNEYVQTIRSRNLSIDQKADILLLKSHFELENKRNKQRHKGRNKSNQATKYMELLSNTWKSRRDFK